MDGAQPERDEQLRRQAQAIAARNPLPLTARSFTRKEYAEEMRREWGCVMGGGAAALVVLPFVIAFDGSDDYGLELAIRIGPYAFGLALLLWLGSFVVKWRVGRSYADPGIVIEVWDEGITITAPGQRHTLAFAAAMPAPRGSGIGRPSFLGISLASPIGPLALDDLLYKGGRTAAAAIVERCAAAAAPAPPGQSEGMGAAGE